MRGERASPIEGEPRQPGFLIAGALAAFILRTFAGRGWMEGTWQQINAVATPLLAYGIPSLRGQRLHRRLHRRDRFGAVTDDRAEHSTFLAE